MTSKEALNQLYTLADTPELAMVVQSYYNIVLKDLEVFEILKKYHLIGNIDVEEVNVVDTKGAHIEYQLRCDFMTIFIPEEEYKVLKEWLEDDK